MPPTFALGANAIRPWLTAGGAPLHRSRMIALGQVIALAFGLLMVASPVLADDWRLAAPAALIVTVAVAAHGIGDHAAWSRALLRPRLLRSATILGLTFPLGGRRGPAAALHVLLWWVLVPLVSTALLLQVGAAVVTWLPPPSGSEVAANAARATQYSGSATHVLLGVLAVGVIEELLHRGPLLAARQLRVIYNPRRVRTLVVLLTLASTVIFGFGHLEFGARNVVATLAYGAVWAAIALRSGSLWPAITAHTLFDAWLFLT